MKHPEKLEGIDLKDLAQQLGSLRYDSLAQFLDHLSDELYRQYQGDMARDRPRLANHLFDAVENIEAAKRSIETAWKVCLPYMIDELMPSIEDLEEFATEPSASAEWRADRSFSAEDDTA